MESHGTPDLARSVPADVERIERMARELATELREAPAEDRAELYSYAATLLRDEVESEAAPLPKGAAARPLGAFGLALLLFLAAALLMLVAPSIAVPVGFFGALATIWGVLSVVVPWHARRRAPVPPAHVPPGW